MEDGTPAEVIEVLKRICPSADIVYNKSTSSILAVYPKDAVYIEQLKTLKPILMSIEPKVRFYTESKKPAILEAINAAEEKIKNWH